MAELPQTYLARTPLLILAASLTAGILLGQFLFINSAALRFAAALIVPLLMIVSLIFLRRKQAMAATLIVTAAFFISGLSLVLIENRSVGLTRIKRMFDGQA